MKEPTEPTCPKCGAPIPSDAPQGLCPKCVMAGAHTAPVSSPHPGHRSPPPSVVEIARHFPELEIIELIGAGGMGAVYRARQPRLERPVALKILSTDLASDPAFAERFNREARVLARLSHPNIVTVFDFGQKGTYFYLLMELVDGVNLRQAMQAGGFTPSDALAVVQDICAALQFAHDEGILHRDIKPENILIDSRGRVKIADFGIAKLIGHGEQDAALTASGAALGTLHYMAPEQLETPADIDQRADIYSLGVVFYELLTGELPLGRFEPPSQRKPMDARLDAVVMRALERERRKRYRSAGEVKTSVEAISKAPGNPDPGSPGPARADGASSRPTARFATASAVLTAVSLFLAVLVVLGSSFYLMSGLPGLSVNALGVVLVPVLVVAGLPALLGCIFGAMALGEVRESGGQRRGLGRALFGTLTWPVLLLVLLTSLSSAMAFVAWFGTGILWLICSTLVTVGLGALVIVTTWRWARGVPKAGHGHEAVGTHSRLGPVAAIAAIIVLFPTLLVLVPWGMLASVERQDTQGETGRTNIGAVSDPSGESEAWRLGKPEIDTQLILPARHVATFALVRTAPAVSAEMVPLQGYALAPDGAPFSGTLKIGSVRDFHSPWQQRMVLRLQSEDGSTASSSHNLHSDWEFDRDAVPAQINLFAEREFSAIVARFTGDPADEAARGTLRLVVQVQSIAVAGVTRSGKSNALVGIGTTNWVENLRPGHRQ